MVFSPIKSDKECVEDEAIELFGKYYHGNEPHDYVRQYIGHFWNRSDFPGLLNDKSVCRCEKILVFLASKCSRRSLQRRAERHGDSGLWNIRPNCSLSQEDEKQHLRKKPFYSMYAYTLILNTSTIACHYAFRRNNRPLLWNVDPKPHRGGILDTGVLSWKYFSG